MHSLSAHLVCNASIFRVNKKHYLRIHLELGMEHISIFRKSLPAFTGRPTNQNANIR